MTAEDSSIRRPRVSLPTATACAATRGNVASRPPAPWLQRPLAGAMAPMWRERPVAATARAAWMRPNLDDVSAWRRRWPRGDGGSIPGRFRSWRACVSVALAVEFRVLRHFRRLRLRLRRYFRLRCLPLLEILFLFSKLARFPSSDGGCAFWRRGLS